MSRLFLFVVLLTWISPQAVASCPDFSGRHTIVGGAYYDKKITLTITQVGCELWTFSDFVIVDENGNETTSNTSSTWKIDGNFHYDAWPHEFPQYRMTWMPSGRLEEIQYTGLSICPWVKYIWSRQANGKITRSKSVCVPDPRP